MPDTPRPLPAVADLTSDGDTIPRGLPRHAVMPTLAMNFVPDGPSTQSSPNAGMPDQLGPYWLVKPLGRGGMGAVYLAEDTQLRRPTALKVMLPEAAADTRSRERFLREARAAAAVRNDHVVTVYQVGDENGTPFIAMELLRGTPLDVYLSKEPMPAMTAIIRLAREIATGLAAAHARGLVHRDIKPGNIWLEAPKGRVKILDFGLARPTKPDREDVDRLTHDGMVMGTPSYMSPEQARGEAVDFRTDLFSLGVVLFRLCTGQLPFNGPTTTAVLTQLAVFDPPPASALNPSVPEALSDLIRRLLAKDPAMRPNSAREVADALRQMDPTPSRPMAAATKSATPPGIEIVEDETGEEIVPPPPPMRSGPRRRGRRKRPVTTDRLIGIGAVLALVALAVGVPIAIFKAIPSKTTADSKPAETNNSAPATVKEQPRPVQPNGESPPMPIMRPAPPRENPRPEPPLTPPPGERPPRGGPPPRFPGGGPPPDGQPFGPRRGFSEPES